MDLEAPGAVIPSEIDEYRIVRRLGGRADGPVLLARDRLLDRTVVLRLLPTGPAGADDRLAAARALARVSHPNLCAVHRVREGAARPYVVTSFAPGEPLSALDAPVPAERLLPIGKALCGAVSALHAAGVASGELGADRVIVGPDGTPRLAGLRGAQAGADPAAMQRDVRSLLSLLERLADPDLRERLADVRAAHGGRLGSQELLFALDPLARPSGREALLEPGPYRGLRPFEAAHAAAFFGRRAEIEEACATLSVAPWLLVAGRSGSGKSSLVQAGVVPAIRAGTLDERPRWDVARCAPGARPLEALAAALAGVLDRDAADLCAELRADPSCALRTASARAEAGLLLVVDPLEEAWTLADAAGRAALFEVLGRFGVVTPGVRIVLAMRSDFLGRLGELGPLGRDLLRATFLLPPLDAARLRQVIVAPARAAGFEVEPAVVEALVAEASGGEALPLLSFALAELWGSRDRDRRIIPESALRALGGAAAALSRRGDVVLATLPEDARRQARRILLSLVTADGTRARRTEGELLSGAGDAGRAALEALVDGRLVVVGEGCELAHDALARVWPRLRAWLDEASDARAAAGRLDAAARDWQRGGRRADALWNDRQVRELELLGVAPPGGPPASAFLAASRAAARARRWRRVSSWLALPVTLGLVAFAAHGVQARQAALETASAVAERLAVADAAAREAAALDARVEQARSLALARYDAGDWEAAEAAWQQVLALCAREATSFAAARGAANLALARDPLSGQARDRAAALAFAWLLVAERDHQQGLVRELTSRLEALDEGPYLARLAAPAHLQATSSPPGARLLLRRVRVGDGGQREPDAGRPLAEGGDLETPPGSYVLEASAPGRYPTRLPLQLSRGQRVHAVVPSPEASRIPPGFVFVPGGETRVGAPDVDGVRRGLYAQPQHEVTVGAFLVAEREATFAQYLAFASSLPAAARAARLPRGPGIALSLDARGAATLTLGGATAREGEPLCRPARAGRRCQDWLRMPAVGLSWDDAAVYAAWLGATSLPGARLCSEVEWERAARGADGRPFPAGDELRAGDANFDATYGADVAQMGIDEVGSFPGDRSPFGVLDMAGNAAEWVGAAPGATPVARGGSWASEAIAARSANRELHPERRASTMGVRVCAPAPEL